MVFRSGDADGVGLHSARSSPVEAATGYPAVASGGDQPATGTAGPSAAGRRAALPAAGPGTGTAKAAADGAANKPAAEVVPDTGSAAAGAQQPALTPARRPPRRPDPRYLALLRVDLAAVRRGAVAGRGKRAIVPPHDPRHPQRQRKLRPG